MSAIAQYLRWQGFIISGSDRLLLSEDTKNTHNILAQMGCTLVNQDGSGITSSTDAVCVSTAIEESNPDIAVAKAKNIPILHRSDVLAAIVQSKKTIAVAGTSGKSTVTAMIFEFLTACQKSPSLISGANLRRLEKDGLIGNAYYGASEYLVIEADESDGTLVKYAPYISVILNVSKDHKTVPEVVAMFEELSRRSTITMINADDTELTQIRATHSFGLQSHANWKPDHYTLDQLSCSIEKNDLIYTLPLPGLHNVSNLCAALSTCTQCECDQQLLADAIPHYKGVARRFTVTKTTKKVFIVDDFAHNPEKIKAAVTAARGLSKRIAAIYQPHGFGPTRFLKNEYIETFKSVFTKGDILYLLPIYYAGGTAQKDISSEILIQETGVTDFDKFTPQNRDELLLLLNQHIKENDCILLMGARDPSLGNFGKKIVDQFGGAQ
jgi:UDP-N-acetylmuramate--alanine ligase